jgi:NADH:ubiquinone oxidoreductase subunit 5 (subunit L)/multisubunit Na+/H+ antiporter MnhA subunit
MRVDLHPAVERDLEEAAAFYAREGSAALAIVFGAQSLVGIPVAIGYYVWAWHSAALVPVSHEQARRAAVDGWLFLAIVALGIVLYLALRQGTG